MAVDFFRRLLWSESTRTGIGRNLVNIPDCINVGDGGLDALIPNVSPNFADVIPNGTSGYQIKSADLWIKVVKRIPMKAKVSDPDQAWKKRLLEKNGTYVLVLFADLTIEQQEDRRRAIIDELTRCGYSDLEDKVRLYSTNHLNRALPIHFQSLVRVLKPEAGVIFTYDERSKFADIKFPANYVLDDKKGRSLSIFYQQR